MRKIFTRQNLKKNPRLANGDKFHPRGIRQSGAVLLISIILSSLVLGAGLSMAKILSREAEFSADLTLSEKSYFAAESGVEIALAKLKSEPVEYISDEEISDLDAKIKLQIDNLVKSFEITLESLQTQKFRMKKDTDGSIGSQIFPVVNFKVESDGKFRWKIICQKSSGTISIQNDRNSGGEIKNFVGIYDDENGVSSANLKVASFFEKINDDEKKTCFFSITNLDSAEKVFKISDDGKIAPHRARIRAVGSAGKREKIVIFDYAQKMLSSFFDFGLLHQKQ